MHGVVLFAIIIAPDMLAQLRLMCSKGPLLGGKLYFFFFG